MKRFLKTKKGVVALLATTVAVAIGAFGAYAYWTSTGNGSGSATVGTSTAWQVDTTAAVGSALKPGVGQQTITYSVKNNDAASATLANVKIEVAVSPGGTAFSDNTGDIAKPACTKNDFELSLNGTTWAAAGAPVNDISLAGAVGTGVTVGPSTVYIRMVNSGTNQDNCKTLTAPLYLTAS